MNQPVRRRAQVQHLYDFDAGRTACGARTAGLGKLTFEREPEENRCQSCEAIYAKTRQEAQPSDMTAELLSR